MFSQMDMHPTSHKLSVPAAKAFHDVKSQLREHRAWTHSDSSSVVLEFLIWHYGMTKFLPTWPDITLFRPETGPGGYPHRPGSEDPGIRPCHVREAAGLKKASLGLPSIPKPG